MAGSKTALRLDTFDSRTTEMLPVRLALRLSHEFFMRVFIVAETPFCFMFVRLSVCPHVSARLSLERLPCNFILETCMEIFLRNLNLVKFAQKHLALYIKTKRCVIFILLT